LNRRVLLAIYVGAVTLAACAESGAGPKTIEPPVASNFAVAPGSAEDDPCGSGNIGNTIYFATDSAVLTPEAQHHAQRQACWIVHYPQHNLTIEGHCRRARHTGIQSGLVRAALRP